MPRFGIVLALLLTTIGLDQVTKSVARGALEDSGGFDLLGGFLLFHHTENTGAFLSLGAGLSDSARFYIFTVAVAAFLGFALWILFTKKNLDWPNTIGLSLLIGGGIGNLIDRAMKASVTDFMQIDIGFARTGVFNVADMAIMAGFFLLFFGSSNSAEKTKGEAKEPQVKSV